MVMQIQMMTMMIFPPKACQKIHAELLKSVNQIYMNLSESGLKKSATNTASLSVKKKGTTITKTKSIELEPSPSEVKEERSSSIAEITLKKSVIHRLKKKMEKPGISEEDNSNPDLLTSGSDERIKSAELTLKRSVIKSFRKAKMVTPDISEGDTVIPDTEHGQPTVSAQRPTSLKIRSNDRVKSAVLKKVKKKKTKKAVSVDEMKSDSLESPSESIGDKLKGFGSGKMEVIIKQKKEKRPKLPL